ncbi:hypothetical protein P691DRAFT_27644 [Macrolepiota fuliginosa MF-IS2]|uniref:Uncharacterized protein n=1 Tax=Macrolepiota fuliginosa MF-IS2 TaxID=1400762 RepID=A0A9P5XCE4_9AGAR|nr:hypothetical protein P691DRAFT_27644 [Macrolepiota fuliginosa MF-IS2]
MVLTPPGLQSRWSRCRVWATVGESYCVLGKITFLNSALMTMEISSSIFSSTPVKNPGYSHGITWEVRPLSLYLAIDYPSSPKCTSKFSTWHNLKAPVCNQLLSHSSDFCCILHQFWRYLVPIATIDSLSSAQQVRTVSV